VLGVLGIERVGVDLGCLRVLVVAFIPALV
jgi:hypothetical protein